MSSERTWKEMLLAEYYTTLAGMAEYRSVWGLVKIWTTFPKGALLNDLSFSSLTTGLNKSKIRSCNSVCGGLFFIFVILQLAAVALLHRSQHNYTPHRCEHNSAHFCEATGKHVTIQKTLKHRIFWIKMQPRHHDWLPNPDISMWSTETKIC